MAIIPKLLAAQKRPKQTVSNKVDQNSIIQNMMNDQKKYIDNIYNQQKTSQMAQLQANQNKALGELNQQKKNLVPQYQSMRNQTDATNVQNAQRLREVMANSGLSASGENVTANVAMNNQRVDSLNQLNLQNQQAVNDINRRISDVNDPAEKNALIAALEAERSRSMYDAYNRSQETGYNRYRDTVADQRYDKEWNYQVGQDKLAEAWKQREWNQLSPAERAAAELDYQYAKKKASLSSGGGGGSSRGRRSSSSKKSSSSSKSSSNLTNQYNQYKSQKATASKPKALANLDTYYKNQENLVSKVRKNPILQPVAPAKNKNLSAWQKMRMM